MVVAEKGDPKPPTEGYLAQPFTKAEWAASNFAAARDLQWFRDAKYGMFIHFGLSTRNKADLSWGICTPKPPDVGKGSVPDKVWQGWTKEFKLEKFDARAVGRHRSVRRFQVHRGHRQA